MFLWAQAVMGEFNGQLPPSQLERFGLQFEQWKYAWCVYPSTWGGGRCAWPAGFN